MNITIESIGPKKARELLDKHWVKEHQRTPSPTTVDAYARAMAANQWVLNHQGIAIDDKNELADGVHRLLAVIQSGATIKIPVARGVAHNGNGADGGVFVIDTIDRGKARTVAQQLQLRHGYANGTTVAATCSSVLALACASLKLYPGRESVGNALRVLEVYGPEVSHCVANRANVVGLRHCGVIGAAAFAMRAYPAEIKTFYERFVSGEGLHRSEAALTLRNFIAQNFRHGHGSLRPRFMQATLYAAMKHVLSEPVKVIKPDTTMGYDFFVEKQRNAVARLLAVCGYVKR